MRASSGWRRSKRSTIPQIYSASIRIFRLRRGKDKYGDSGPQAVQNHDFGRRIEFGPGLGGADFEGLAEGLHGAGYAVDLGGVAEIGEAIDSLRRLPSKRNLGLRSRLVYSALSALTVDRCF